MIDRLAPVTTLPDGVKATTGGKFDRNRPLTYFIATNPVALLAVEYPHVLVAVNEVDTPKSLDALDRLCDTRDVMLDSGIFNLAMEHARAHGVSHDTALALPPEEIDGFDRLWDRYGDIATRYADRLWGVVELDQGGSENKPRTRARIEHEFGIVPMPVYHPLLDGWDYYDTLASQYDRLCFGNIVQASPPLRLRLSYTAAHRASAYPYLWTHLLGMTPNENTLAMPMRGSMDSSSWLTAARWYPSWHAKAMLKRAGNYPPPMWVDPDTSEPGGIMKVIEMNLLSLAHTLSDLREDTAVWAR